MEKRWKRRCMEVQQEGKGKEGEKIGKGRREYKERKERNRGKENKERMRRKGEKKIEKKKRERKEEIKERRRGIGTNVAHGAKHVLTVSPHFRANLRCVWFGYCCVTVKGRFQGVSGLSRTEHYVPGRQNPEHNGKRGYAQISAHLCKLAASTLDGHNFLV